MQLIRMPFYGMCAKPPWPYRILWLAWMQFAYAATPLVHSAVERKFEIIGEAPGQLATLDAALASRIPGLPQIIAFRNPLIHGHAKVNHGTVWNVVQDSLPPLLSCVQMLLQEMSKT